MQTELRRFMEDVAFRNQIQMVIAECVFTNTSENKKVLSLPGSTYGFCVRLNDCDRGLVFNEAVSKGTSRFHAVQEWHPFADDIYPLYWGKDRMLGARIHQHLKNTKKTGLARLCAYRTLHGKEIACISLTVDRYSDFETILQKERPPFIAGCYSNSVKCPGSFLLTAKEKGRREQEGRSMINTECHRSTIPLQTGFLNFVDALVTVQPVFAFGKQVLT